MRKIFQIRFIGIAICLLSLKFISCNYCGDETPLRLAETATNLEALNSPYDDWNCADMRVHFYPSMFFLFSSNRNTKGGTFDLIPHQMDLYSNTFDADVYLPIGETSSYQYENEAIRIAKAINTDQDELGPSIIVMDGYSDGFTFSRGDSNNHDLWILYSPDSTMDLSWALYNDKTTQEPITVLNSSADDGYLTYHKPSHSLIFHSNRSGVYRLYEAKLPTEKTLKELIKSPFELEIIELEELSSPDGEERTPFIRDNTLYFISTRTGGFGGRDIWKSDWDSSSGWTSITNLGSKINSSEDEYRPMVLDVDGNSNFKRVIFFSSNRDGGLGGYDLYYSGL